MADLSITAANVAPGSDAVKLTYTSGATITQGQTCYQNSSDSKVYLTDGNVTATESVFVGVALNSATAGQPITLQTSGSLTTGGTMTVGQTYWVSNTAGAVQNSISAGTFNTIVYIATSATVAMIVGISSQTQQA